VEDYGIDGLRLDAVGAARDGSPRHVFTELADRVHATEPRPLVIAETSVDDDQPLDEWGHDARWADGLHHALHAALTGEREGYYAPYGSVDDVAPSSAARPPERHVVCAQDHDQVGNRALGDRLAPELLRVASSVVLFSPQTPLLFMGEEYGEPTRSSSSPTTSRPRSRGGRAGGPQARVRRLVGVLREDVPDPQDERDVPALEALAAGDAAASATTTAGCSPCDVPPARRAAEARRTDADHATRARDARRRLRRRGPWSWRQ
jgi:maltooligosyltrehalose trehalohydrolase